jgi:tetratricopeptide (TPR) repeat protein
MELRHLKEEAGDLWARGKFAQAEVLYRQALLQQPRDPQLWVRHAEALKRLGRTQEAVDSYLQAASMLAELSHFPRAVAAVRLALELKPDDLDLISELIRMELRKNVRENRAAAPSVASSRAVTEESMLALPVLEEPVTNPGITIEIADGTQWPQVRRLSGRSVALKSGPEARWVIIESATDLRVSFADSLPASGEKDDGLA